MRTDVVAMLCEELKRLKEWKSAVEDAAIVNWTLNAENANNPRKAIADLIGCIMRESLDPMRSQPAAELHAKVAALEQQVAALRADAERYRWLKANRLTDDMDDAFLSLPVEMGDRIDMGEAMDTAIDAARANPS